MHRLLVLQIFLLTLCAAENQTLLVTTGDTGISINGTDSTDDLDLPPEFYPMDNLLRIGVQLYTVDSNETVEELCAMLKYTDPSVISCEGDILVSLDQTNATDDPLIAQQSNLDVIRATDAWTKGYVGDAAVRVCIVDSGAPLDHPDFGANLWTNAAEADGRPGVDNDDDGVVADLHGAAFLNGVASGDVQDQNSHGSWTTGAVGATTNNDVGIASVPQTVTIIPCRYLDATGNGQVSDGLRCWDYCMKQGAMILSNSWGAASHVQAMDSAIAAVTSAGGLVICSAGNDGISVDATPHYPSSYAETNAQVVSVAASDTSNNLWLRSNYGVKGGVTLAAPGVQLLGLGLAGLYFRNTGTSMSAPQVAGVAVLQYAHALKAGIDIKGNVQLAQEAKKAMAGSTKAFASTGTHTIPVGIVDAVAAVEALDIAALQAVQRQQATATASVGVWIAVAIVCFGLGGLVVGLAMTIAHRRRDFMRDNTPTA